MNAGSIQRFTNIDIAEAGDDALVEQEELDGSASAGEPSPQLAGIEIERLRAERLERRPMSELVRSNQVERSEAPGVVEREPMALIGFNNEMVVLECLGRIDPPLPGHAEGKDQA